MAIFARFNGLSSMKHTSTLIALTIGVITATSAAHAEKYCKSVDQNGNASYTLAPETGCKKKFKTVGIRQFVAPTSAPTSPANTEQNKSTNNSGNAPAAVNPVTAPAANNMPTAKSSE